MKIIPETRRAHYIWYLRFYSANIDRLQQAEEYIRGVRPAMTRKLIYIASCYVHNLKTK